MKSVLLKVLDGFTLFWILCASFIAHITLLALLPNSPSALAPDEGTYAGLAKWVAESKSVEQFPTFGAELYYTSRSLTLPAALLIKLGVDSLLAVRLVSIFASIVATFIFAKILLCLVRVNELREIKNTKARIFISLSILSFAFMPSAFVWSTLGLRESVSKLWILASVYALIKLRSHLLENKSHRFVLFALSLFVLFVSFAFGSRRQTAFVFLIFFCTLLTVLIRQYRPFVLAVSLILGFLGGLTFSSPLPVKWEEERVWRLQTNAGAKGALEEQGLDIPCDPPGKVVRTSDGLAKCFSERRVRLITATNFVNQIPVKSLDALETQREANRIGAQTALSDTRCNDQDLSTVSQVLCNARELPYRLFSISIRPLPLFDTGSTSNNLASLENILWISLFAFFALSCFRLIKEGTYNWITLPTLSYVSAFLILSSLYEGNLGTAFRHKSTILWCLLLVIALSSYLRATSSQKFKEQE